MNANEAPIPTAELPRIDYAKLLCRDPKETSDLFDACHTQGIFYLNLTGFGTILDDVQNLLKSMDWYAIREDLGRPVTFSFRGGFRVELPGHYGVSRSLVDGRLLERVNNTCDAITKTILGRLSDIFGLPYPDGSKPRFEKLHRNCRKSRTHLSLARYPSRATQEYQPAIDVHADIDGDRHREIGSLALTFGEHWGMQVLGSDGLTWSFVAPRRNHAVVNVGDALQGLSDQKLRSRVHRVMQETPSAIRDEHRYSVTYLLGPEDEVRYADADGEVKSAKEWQDGGFQDYLWRRRDRT